jgi:hypothetical protein
MIQHAFAWNTTPAERARSYPCDALCTPYDHDLWRAVTIDAPPPVVFRWLCQLRAAPYSYDWIDNFGRRSPQQLTPGLDRLAPGQTVMTIFRLAAFVPDEHLTIVVQPWPWFKRLFGDAAISYVVVPLAPNRARLIAKLRVRYPPTLLGWIARGVLPPGDLVMIRRQLLNLKQLAERTSF